MFTQLLAAIAAVYGVLAALITLLQTRQMLEARPWEAGVNRVIAAAARRYPNVVMANWFATIEHRTTLLWPDEVHPQPSGARLYARMVASAVQAARTAGAGGQASGSGLPPAAHRVAPLG